MVRRMETIDSAKARCIANENFEAAKALKDVRNQIHAIALQLAKMEVEKNAAVVREDYDTASELRDTMLRLSDGVDAKLESRLPITGRRE